MAATGSHCYFDSLRDAPLVWQSPVYRGSPQEIATSPSFGRLLAMTVVFERNVIYGYH